MEKEDVNTVSSTTLPLIPIEKKPTDKSNAIPIYCRFTIYSVTNVDTLLETFDCNFFYGYKWLNPSIVDEDIKKIMKKEKKNESPTLIDYVNYLVEIGDISSTKKFTKIEQAKVWSPSLIFQNQLSCENITDYGTTLDIKWEKDGPLVHRKYRQRITFSNQMPLKMFPFDEQKLSMILYCSRPITECIIVKDPSPSVIDHAKIHLQEWKVFPGLEILHEESDPSASSKDTARSEYITSIKIERKAGSYLWNIFLFIWLLVMVTFCAFIERDFSNRMNIIVTLLLTAVAFKLVVASSIPKVPYLTLLDVYVLSANFIIVISLVENAIISLLEKNDILSSGGKVIVDIVAVVILAVAFLLLHLVLRFVVQTKKVQFQSAKLDKNDKVNLNLSSSNNLTNSTSSA